MLRVQDLIRDPTLHIGREVTVRGYFVNTGDHDCWLAADFESIHTHEGALFLSHPDLFELAFSILPPMGGGGFAYAHEAIVRGVFDRSAHQDFQFELREIRSLRSTDSLEWYTVI